MDPRCRGLKSNGVPPSGVGVVSKEQPCQIFTGRVEGEVPMSAIYMLAMSGAHSAPLEADSVEIP